MRVSKVVICVPKVAQRCWKGSMEGGREVSEGVRSGNGSSVTAAADAEGDEVLKVIRDIHLPRTSPPIIGGQVTGEICTAAAKTP
jgi:hypothetical protein